MHLFNDGVFILYLAVAKRFISIIVFVFFSKKHFNDFFLPTRGRFSTKNTNLLHFNLVKVVTTTFDYLKSSKIKIFSTTLVFTKQTFRVVASLIRFILPTLINFSLDQIFRFFLDWTF